jgi:hypothetical protein
VYSHVNLDEASYILQNGCQDMYFPASVARMSAATPGFGNPHIAFAHAGYLTKPMRRT